jgi:hypothetical protein
MTEENKRIILNWINNNFSEIGNINPEEFNTEKKQIKILIQCIKAYLNREHGCNFKINSNYTKLLYAHIHTKMSINFIENDKSDIKVYLFKIALLCRGYNCDFNGIYSKITMRIFKQWCKDNNISHRKYPYSINSNIWYKLLTNEKE